MATTPSGSDENESESYDQIPPNQRQKALENDNYSCQLCPNKGPQAGGSMPLQVHHKSYNPDDCELHDLDNLTTLCINCHGWHHNRPTPETPPINIADEAESKLIPTDFEILDVLAQDGPLTTEVIADRISSDKSLVAVEERLWRIMGIDTVVSDQPQLLDQDANSNKWGLPYQIDTTQRHVPDQVPAIVRRTVDSIVASAIARGCDRDTVAEVIDVHTRTTYRIQYRGQAHNFSVSPHIGQGRPTKTSFQTSQSSDSNPTSEQEGQQHLDDLADSGVNVDDDNTSAAKTNGDSATVKSNSGSTEFDEISADCDDDGNHDEDAVETGADDGDGDAEGFEVDATAD